MTQVAPDAGYFLVQFMSVGMVNAYGGLWLEGKGLSEAQIGVVFALPIAVTLFLTFSIGRIADRASDWRSAIIVGMVLAAVAPFGLLAIDGFYSILTVWTVMVVAQVSTIPVVDAAGLRFGKRNGLTLGGLRALTTFGYLSVILAAGPLIDHFGLAAFLPCLLVLVVLRALVACALPRLRAQENEVVETPPLPLDQLKTLWFVAPLLGAALILATVQVLNAFQAVVWARQGLATSTIGQLIALGAFAEFLMFVLYPRLPDWLTAQRMLLIAATFTILRWWLLSFDLPVLALIGVQSLHALSYAVTFLASAIFIAQFTGEDIAAQAQSVFVVVQQALGMVCVLAFGPLVGAFGAGAYVALAAVAALGTILIAAGWRRTSG